MLRSAIFALILVLSAPLAQAQEPAAPAAPADTTPRPGVDYDVLTTPIATYGKGKIEVAEVFSYGCHFCAAFQPFVNTWKKTMPASVRWEYVPAAFGGYWDEFARAYFAADALGVQKKTHDAVFKAVFVDQAVKSGTSDEIADMYAKLGVDRGKFVNAAQSAGVAAKVARARQFALNAGIDATPTIVLNGKYRIQITRDRSYQGAIDTLNYLLAKERL
jgi:thiol:disulfide interchange protein DsbA